MRILEIARRWGAKIGRGRQRRGAAPEAMPPARARRGREEGSALVEMALISPFLFTIMLGMYSLSMALYNYEQLCYSAFNAAQQVGAGRGLLTDPCATVASEVPAGLPSWTSSKFTYTLTITDSTGTAHLYGPTGSSFSCTAGASEMSENEPITVGVSYTYTWIPAYLMSLSGNLSTTETVLTD